MKENEIKLLGSLLETIDTLIVTNMLLTESDNNDTELFLLDIQKQFINFLKQNKTVNNKQKDEIDNHELKETKALLSDAIFKISDFLSNGTMHDVNPTGKFKDCGCFDSLQGDNWQGYIKSMDDYVRNSAKDFLDKEQTKKYITNENKKLKSLFKNK